MGLHNAQHIPRNNGCRHMLSDVFHPVLCDISKKLKVRIQLPYRLLRLVCGSLGASEEVCTFWLRREDEQARGCIANTFVKGDSLDDFFRWVLLPEILTSRVKPNQVIVVSEDGSECLSPSKNHLNARASWTTLGQRS